ncbi:MAG: universal stress protein [Acidobacteria bacterium]|nr:MAG: universal stress protein [Acidobacteriota bacterium]
MTEIKTILCPVDFSAFSRHALQHAAQLAKWFNSQLIVFYVYAPPVSPPPVLFGGLPGPIPPQPFPPLTASPEQTQAEVTAQLTKFAATVDLTGMQVRIKALPGSPVRDILDEAKTVASDLIVLGTHGHTGFDRLVLGSVTEKVLRKATCAVLTVPPPVSTPPADPVQLFKRILCPMDFSDASLKALEHALSLAKEADAELLLMHVIEGLPEAPDWQQPAGPAVAEYLRLSEEHALARLRAAVPADAQAWCRPETLVLTGKPYEVILRLVAERDVRLVVMGVHGRNPIDRFFFGSTTNHVVRAATCPVLTLKD